MHYSTLVTSLALFSTTGWAGYVLEDDYFAQGFFDQFSFFDAEDPTHGFVQYKGYNDAYDAQLVSNTSSNVIMSVDSTNNTPNGRPSVRITSNKSYNSGLVVVDIEHMPGGICGTWPAFWMVGPNWPNGGEIDIIEGVNDQSANDATLHTGPGCSISNNGGFSGTMKYSTCASSGDNNNGCQIASGDDNTYGSGFNSNGGGVYATEWTSDYITVHFFPRGSIPDDVLGDSPDPSSWGTPMARFTGDCDFGTSFVEQQIVFDTTFCGDWAGQTWSQSSTCAAKANTCEAYVQNNPEAFQDAYWSVNALKVYKSGGDANPSPAPSTYTAISTSLVYITQPTAQPITTPAPVPTTFAYSTKSSGYVPVVGPSGVVGGGGVPVSPAETGSSGYAPVVGSDGTVDEGGNAPAATSTQDSYHWTTNPDGSAGYNSDGWKRHARHLAKHNKRHRSGLL